MPKSHEAPIDLSVYGMLTELEAGFAQARSALVHLKTSRGFQHSEVARHARLIEEARAAVSSYLLGVMEEIETREAGRLFRARRKDEQKQNKADS